MQMQVATTFSGNDALHEDDPASLTLGNQWQLRPKSKGQSPNVESRSKVKAAKSILELDAI
jgi:hypothetical protein